MQHQPDQELEQFVHERLRRLPAAKAPATLAPRVLAAIRAQSELPWWRRAWWTWPAPCQAAFGTLTMALLGLLGTGGFRIASQTELWTQRLQNLASLQFATLQTGDTAQAVQTAVSGLTRQPYALHAAGIALLVYLACVGLGTLGFKLALKRI
jgi:hypothetical protein